MLDCVGAMEIRELRIYNTRFICIHVQLLEVLVTNKNNIRKMLPSCVCNDMELLVTCGFC